MLEPAAQQRIDEQLELAVRARELVPGRAVPYHGHLRVRTDQGTERDVLLGSGFHTGPGIALIDWRSAPLAEVFFASVEGEDYAVDIDGRTLEGDVLQRNLVVFEGGQLVEVACPLGVFRRAAGGWDRVLPPPLPALLPASRRASPVAVRLDETQRRAVEMPAGRGMLVLGEAGCGKTTVALHRLLRLREAAAKKTFRAAVIVPAEGLRAFVQSLLERMGVDDDVEVLTYERFASKAARRAFPDVRRRESQNTSPLTIALKRHEALRPLLRAHARKALPQREEEARGAALARREDLHALFGDTTVLREVVDRAGGVLRTSAIETTVEHTRIQFMNPTESDFSHVDADSLVTSDGRTIDEGTPMEDAGTVDVEDFAVLFELDRLRAEARGAHAIDPRKYDCIVLDEAQELAPLELTLVGRSLSRKGTLVVAGDAAQQIDPAANFRGWPAAMRELGMTEFDLVELEVSYRCPPDVTAFARALRQESGAGRFEVARFASECHLAAWLVDALRALAMRDPGAQVAVITRTASQARVLAQTLRHGLNVHLALEGRFRFRPGVEVTCVEEVKGLEFDHVILPDASVSMYPDTPDARRALYVAATRVSGQLVLACSGTPTPLAAP